MNAGEERDFPPPTIRPFCSGIAFAIWEHRNCSVCAHSGQDALWDGGEYHWGTCEMEDALTTACVGYGEVPKGLAETYGWRTHRGYWTAPWRCSERQVAP